MKPLAAGVLLVTILHAVQPAPDPARVLADMRQALGGDAVIAGVRTFFVTGTESRTLNGHVASADIEWLCQLPDRFIRVRRVGTPRGIDVNTDGFNADAHIRHRESDMPYPPDPFENDTPDQRVQREKQAVRNLKHEFSRFAIAMIGIPAVDPLDASTEPQQTVEGTVLDVVALRSTDGYEARLYVDSGSHLPFAIAWIGTPIVTLTTSTSQTVRVPRGQSPDSVRPQPPTVPPGDPTAGLPKVLHQLRFSEFTMESGLNWPHRIVETVGANTSTTTKLGRFKINPNIDQKKFATR